MATRPISCSAGTAAATTRRMLLGPRRPTPLPTTRTTVASFPIHSPSTSTAARTITSSTTTAINQPHRITTQQPLQRRAPPITAQTTRTYHSHDHPPPPGPFTPAEASLLSAAYAHVPAHGFTPSALALGARDTGLLDISPSILPDGDGSFSLIRWHLHVQKRALLKEEKLGGGGVHGGGGTMMTVEDKVEALAWARLRGNETAGVVGRWQEALALMAQPSYVPASLASLAELADEILYLAGDVSVDPSWYTKRASLSAIYAAAELFQTTDQSPGFRETRAFLRRRLDEAAQAGGAVRSVGEWIGFSAGAAINVLRSKGLRI